MHNKIEDPNMYIDWFYCLTFLFYYVNYNKERRKILSFIILIIYFHLYTKERRKILIQFSTPTRLEEVGQVSSKESKVVRINSPSICRVVMASYLPSPSSYNWSNHATLLLHCCSYSMHLRLIQGPQNDTLLWCFFNKKKEKKILLWCSSKF